MGFLFIDVIFDWFGCCSDELFDAKFWSSISKFVLLVSVWLWVMTCVFAKFDFQLNNTWLRSFLESYWGTLDGVTWKWKLFSCMFLESWCEWDTVETSWVFAAIISRLKLWIK